MMGNVPYYAKYPKPLPPLSAEDVAEQTARLRMQVVDKIVMAFIDEITSVIIRPGPKPEERECYVVAQELRDHSSKLRSLVVKILNVEAEEARKSERKSR